MSVCGCVSLNTFHVVWQFVNHGSDFEKTKLKLLDAANLVDKVRRSSRGNGRKIPLGTGFEFIFLAASAVLQAPEHPGGFDRPGGLDRPGHDQRLRQPSQHPGGVPVLEEQAAPQAAQRQRSAHHVSRPPVRSNAKTFDQAPSPPPDLAIDSTFIFRDDNEPHSTPTLPVASVQLELTVMVCTLCPGGGRSRAPPSAWHLSKPCAPTTSQAA